MTITRIFQAGFETGDWNEWDSTFVPASQISAVDPKTGTYSGRLGSSSGNANNGYVIRNIDAGIRQMRYGMFVNPVTHGAAPPLVIVAFRSGTPAVLASLSFGSNNWNLNANALSDSDAGSAAAGWMHIGIDIKIHATDGWMYVYKDGVEIMSVTGNTGNADIRSIVIGVGIDGNEWQSLIYVDDIYVDNSTDEVSAAPLYMKRFPLIKPNANGNYSNWTGSDGNSVDNYQLVDEIPHTSDTDYVYATAADVVDSYGMTTYTLAADEACIAVIPIAFCKRAGTTEQIALGTRFSSTDSVGSDQTPGSSYALPLAERQTTKPGGGPWTQAAVDDVEIIIKSRGTYS